MLFNILLFKYTNKILDEKFFNKLFFIVSSIYGISFFIFHEIILFILVLDSVYFLYRLIKINSIIKHKTILKNSPLKSNTKNIEIVPEIIKVFKKNLDPEFEGDRFKPYTFNLPDAIREISNNLS